MNPRLLLALSAVVVLPLVAAPAASSPEGAPAHAEMRAEVPALNEFHEVIYTLWHEAWPKKDGAAMRALLPEIRRRAETVVQAELPGILRERKAAWEGRVKELQAVVAEYAAAAEGTDDQRLLDAGEQLHAQFEKLVRTIRPAIRELDAFHVVLYQLYHYDLPGGDLAAMRATVARLEGPMAALDAAKLPPRLADRQKEFAAARRKLSAAVDRLVAAARSNDRARITRAIETMHTRYQALDVVFD